MKNSAFGSAGPSDARNSSIVLRNIGTIVSRSAWAARIASTGNSPGTPNSSITCMGSMVNSLNKRHVDIEVLKPPKVVCGTCCRLPLHSAKAFLWSAGSGRSRGVLALQFDPELQQHNGGLFSGFRPNTERHCGVEQIGSYAGRSISSNHFYLAIPQSVDAPDHPDFPLFNRSAQDW